MAMVLRETANGLFQAVQSLGGRLVIILRSKEEACATGPGAERESNDVQDTDRMAFASDLRSPSPASGAPQ